MSMSSDTVKRLSLELGGNAAFIVFDDADIDQAVKAAVASKFRNAGQTCVCADRFLIHDSVADEFNAKLCAEISAITVGSGSKKGIEMGPLISSEAVKCIHAKVKTAIDDGAQCLSGGNFM